ncbi:hypothetical protein BJ875DRAFT_181156 [Amylocarpus encephaloides]|uniref:Lysine-specific metallo-endopeptidase domain-containing protein n=1 Tax=Amylocarpus encephaloides TaxID=45428 RepID=A0A9P7Y9P4_9HELO|nr:hypothetical protein BJ875DRAFT_181156 [Amylocarpus encephaloides]
MLSLHTMKLFRPLILPALVWGSDAATIVDLFNTKGGTGLGACSATQVPIVESWLQDTVELVDFALQGLSSYKTDRFIQRNLGAFFSIRTTKAGNVFAQDQAKFATVEKTLQVVQDFLYQRNPQWTVEGDGTGKPWLFCNSDWQSETEDLFDEQGNPVLDPNDNTKQASLRTFPLTGNIAADQLLKDMQQGTPPNWDSFAYYSTDLKDYVIEVAANRYPGNPPATPRSWCNGHLVTPDAENRFALTESRLTRDAVTLCPDAFTTSSEPFETIDAAMADPAAARLGTPLNDASPRSLTLFHELIHMTTGPDQTPDSASMFSVCP